MSTYLIHIHQLQHDVHELIQEVGGGYWPLLAILARLVEEIGELVEAINQQNQELIAEESADLFIVSTCIANLQQIDLLNAYQQLLSEKNEQSINSIKENTTNNNNKDINDFSSSEKNRQNKAEIEATEKEMIFTPVDVDVVELAYLKAGSEIDHISQINLTEININVLYIIVGKLARRLMDITGHKKPKTGETYQSLESILVEFHYWLVQFADINQFNLFTAVKNKIAHAAVRDKDRFKK